MHAAPPVRLACNRGRHWPRLQAGLSVATAVVLAVWSSLLIGWPPPAVAGIAAAAGLVVVICRGRWSDLPCELVWDGQAWAIDDLMGEVSVELDLGGWMLLQFRPKTSVGSTAGPAWARPLGVSGPLVGARLPGWRGVRWLEVRSVDAGAHFHLWRAALHGPRAAPAGSVVGGA